MFTTGLRGIHDEISLEISKEQLVEGYFNRGWLFILSRWLFGYNHLLWRLLIGWKRKAMIEYRNKYRDGGDCLDIEDRGWFV